MSYKKALLLKIDGFIIIILGTPCILHKFMIKNCLWVFNLLRSKNIYNSIFLSLYNKDFKFYFLFFILQSKKIFFKNLFWCGSMDFHFISYKKKITFKIESIKGTKHIHLQQKHLVSYAENIKMVFIKKVICLYAVFFCIIV